MLVAMLRNVHLIIRKEISLQEKPPYNLQCPEPQGSAAAASSGRSFSRELVEASVTEVKASY